MLSIQFPKCPRFMVVLLIPLSLWANNNALDSRKNFVGDLNTAGIPVHGTFKQDTIGFQILSDNWGINYQRCLIYSLQAPENTMFEISVLSDKEKVGISLIDLNLNVIAVGEEDSKRKYRKVIKIDLKKSERYWVIVGSGTKTEDVDFSVISRIASQELISDPTLIKGEDLPLGTTRHLFEKNFLVFQGKRAKFFNIKQFKDAKKWLVINVNSNDFDTIAYILNEYNQVITFNDDIERGRITDSMVSLSPEDSYSTLVVADYKASIDSPKFSENTFNISVKLKAYDPEGGAISFIRYILSDPLIMSIFTLVAAVVISGYFYWRGIHRKIIKYRIVTDHQILAESEASPLKLRSGDEEFNCASLFKIRLLSRICG